MVDQNSESGSLLRGVALGVLLNLGISAAAFVIRLGAGTLFFGFVGFLFLTVLLYLGLAQAAWILPFYFTYRKRGDFDTANGVAMAGAITFIVWAVLLLVARPSPAAP